MGTGSGGLTASAQQQLLGIAALVLADGGPTLLIPDEPDDAAAGHGTGARVAALVAAVRADEGPYAGGVTEGAWATGNGGKCSWWRKAVC